MLSKEDLLKDIEELYDAYVRSEPERLRLKSLNSTLLAEVSRLKAEITALKAKFLELSDKAVAKIRKQRARILHDAKLIAELKAENETLRNNSAPALLTPSSEWPREFLFLRSPHAGGIVANIFNRMTHNERYNYYIGYLYEYRGFNVEYCGIANGVHDDGIDLICRKDDWAILVRCKEQGTNAILIHYLAARALRFKMDNPGLKVGALYVTSQILCHNTRKIAAQFSIAVKDNMPFRNFPYVKCKVLADGRKVFCTPNDAAYLTMSCDTFCDNENDAIQQGFQAM